MSIKSEIYAVQSKLAGLYNKAKIEPENKELELQIKETEADLQFLMSKIGENRA